MTREVTTISPNCSVRQAAELIYQKKYGCLPVIDEQRKLKGIITDHDFVGITIQLLEIMETSEPIEEDDDL
jgi:CBS-domain-containing membrane protein